MFASALGGQPHDVVRRIESVQESHRFWTRELDSGRLAGLPQLKSDFYISWAALNKAELFQEFCRRTNLQCEPTAPPAYWGSVPVLEKSFRSDGICLESRSLLDHLLNYRDIRDRIAYCRSLRATRENDRFSVAARTYDREGLLIRSQSLVFSAGAGNEKLTDELFRSEADSAISAVRQQTVKTFMLVVQHPKGSLPLLGGMFPDMGGIFMASRQDLKGRPIWLIGDRQRELVSTPGEMTAFDAASWFSKLRIEFERLFPKIINEANNYRWGIYEATKAEPWTASRRFEGGGAFPDGYWIHKHVNAPVWVTWPTLLTFAPKVSNLIVTDLLKVIKPGFTFTNRPVWDNFRITLTTGECRWKTTALLSWTEFKRCFDHYGVQSDNKKNP
jgi:hypothetical protein